MRDDDHRQAAPREITNAAERLPLERVIPHRQDLVERGKQAASKQKDSLSAAVDAGREAYQREKTKAQ